MKLYAVQTVRWHGEIKYVYKDVHNGGIKVEGRQELIDIAAEQIRASLFAFLLCKSHVSMPRRYIYLCSFQPWAVLTFARASLYHGSCTVDPFLFFPLHCWIVFSPGIPPFFRICGALFPILCWKSWLTMFLKAPWVLETTNGNRRVESDLSF